MDLWLGVKCKARTTVLQETKDKETEDGDVTPLLGSSIRFAVREPDGLGEEQMFGRRPTARMEEGAMAGVGSKRRGGRDGQKTRGDRRGEL